MSETDWATVAGLATALGTLILAVATFSAVRSANLGDIGFWQGAFRNPEDPRYSPARKAIEDREPWTVELLYGDHEGGQRAISRFTMLPLTTGDPDADPEGGWLASQSRHWNVDRPDPR